jgi:hypothetical protein
MDQSPFTLMDISFRVHIRRYPVSTISINLLDQATFFTYAFTKQEAIGLARSRDRYVCPVHCTANRVRHLCTYHAPPDTPLFNFFDLKG